MTEAIFRHREARAGELGLFPVDDEGAELMRGIKVNRDVSANVIQRRNPRHHRLFFAILNFVKMHCPRFENATTEQIKTSIKLATGHVDTAVDIASGEVVRVPRSIAWAAMDQTKFNEFFADACNAIAQRWMPAGTTAEAVRRELIEMVDGPQALEARR
jgi:hypothetical protein